MHYNIRISGLIGDSLTCTPAVHSFYHKIKEQGDTLDMWVIHETYDLHKDFPYADSVVRIDGEQWHSLNGLPNGQWLTVKDGSKLLSLDDTIAFHMCGQIKSEFCQGHRMHGYAYQTGVQVASPHYHILIPEDEQQLYNEDLLNLSNDKKIVICSPYSRTCSSLSGGPANKMPRFEMWKEVKEYLESKNYYVLFVSSPAEPKVEIIGGNWQIGQSLRKIASWLKQADFCIMLDNGISNMAAAMDANILQLNAAIPARMIELSHTNGKYEIMDKHGIGSISSFTSAEVIEKIKEKFETE